MKKNHHPGYTRLPPVITSHESIATKAYELWVSRGNPEDQSNAIWLAAEQELLAGQGKAVRSPALLPVSF